MALADFLSAIRALILDDGVIGATAADRRAALAARFPRLSDDQLDDLADISPARLQVYTDLIFAGERSTLEWVYPVSLAVIGQLRADAGDGRPPRLANFELVRALHRFRPWKSSSQRQLAADFEDFIRAERTEWTEAWPGIGELIDLERTELDIFYAEDVPHKRFTAQVCEMLTAFSVEALLARSILVPPYAAIRSYEYDVPEFAQRFRKSSALRTPLPGSSPSLAACGRNETSLMPDWVRLDEPAHRALDRLPRSTPIEINGFATAYLEAG